MSDQWRGPGEGEGQQPPPEQNNPQAYPPPQDSTFPPPQGGGFPPPPQDGFAPPQGGFPPPQGGFPPQQGGAYPPQGGAYPPQDGPYGGGPAPMPAPAMGYAPAANQGLPEGLKLTAIIVSVVKGIPVLLLFIMAVYLLTVADNLDDFDELGFGADAIGDTVLIAALLIMVFIAIGAAMLFFQIRSAVKANLLPLIVVSGILSAIDLLWTLSAILGDGSAVAGFLIFGLTLAAQATVFIWALRLRSAPSAPAQVHY